MTAAECDQVAKCALAAPNPRVARAAVAQGIDAA
jgi:hypothetical protein